MLTTDHRTTALELAGLGIPVTPLRQGKIPFANCANCKGLTCGERPNSRAAGPCQCPRPCHGWSAATTDMTVLNSPEWAPYWQDASAVAWHPGGADMTVLDLDNAGAVTWARETLPSTRTVPTTRGEHWLYLGAMQSSNGVRPGVDIKSRMAYARWRGCGTGTMAPLPDSVRALIVREEATGGRALGSAGTWTPRAAGGCRHSERYVRRGLDMAAEYLLTECGEGGAHNGLFSRARAIGRAHAECGGPCGLEVMAAELAAVAVSVGLPERQAVRQAERGVLGPR